MMGFKVIDEVGFPQAQQIMIDWTSGIVIFVMVLMGAELLLRTSEWWTARQAGKDRKLLPNDAIPNMATTAIYNLTLRGIGVLAMIAPAFWAYQHSHWKIPLNWWTLPAYILAAEFWSYFFHRMMHEMRLFWADHAVHHSSEEFDFTTAQRFHVFEWVPKVIVFVPLAAMGFHPLVLFMFTTLAGIQLICHTARFGRWGWWDKWFVSPTIHGVHHARNPIYMDRNLGGALNVWDHVFGTYQNATEEKLIYGVTHSPRTSTKDTNALIYTVFYPIKVLFWEYTFLVRDFIHAPTLKDKVIVLFGRPGETFEVTPGAAKSGSATAPIGAPAAVAA
jgi:sterol desaturase/sphingolipid hydroxylase (fatty acid hydroxylase superfamily)